MLRLKDMLLLSQSQVLPQSSQARESCSTQIYMHFFICLLKTESGTFTYQSVQMQRARVVTIWNSNFTDKISEMTIRIA